ncbi:hypothetical protein M404DRAFT_164548, partial [Pisolithus tinctorius Marx 270]
HGKAASVDLAAVRAEQQHIAKILEKFNPKYCWNFNETSLFAFAPPDQGLATRQMSRTKRNKFCLTLGFTCNSDGSEKMPIFFIGQCKKPPASHGFDYHNNKAARMTSELFEE